METVEERNARLSAWFHEHFEHGVAFNAHAGVRIPRWDAGGVEFHLAYRPELGAHEGVFHGGVIAALIDTCGCGAVLAGHDFSTGSRITTVDLNVHFLRMARGDVVASGTCVKRGRSLNFAEVVVRTADGNEAARGTVTALVSGDRPCVD